jgi:dolichol kinase
MDKLELKRQIFHIICGIILVILIKYDVLDFLRILILLIGGLILSILSKKVKIPIINWFLTNFDREKDKKKMPGKGAIMYITGLLIVYGLFITQPYGKNIVMASMMILALGDASPLFVRHIARIKHPFNDKKFIEGALLGAMLGFLGAVIFVEPIAALIASFTAMFAEGIEIRLGLAEVDDNITIPVVAAAVIWLVHLV